MMVVWFILGVVVGQLTFMAVIIFILVRLLNKHLVQLAVERFEALPDGSIDRAAGQLTVVVAGQIPGGLEEKLVRLVSLKMNGPMSIAIKQDPSIFGGVMIFLPGQTIDYSLRCRLKESGLIGRFFGCS